MHRSDEWNFERTSERNASTWLKTRHFVDDVCRDVREHLFYIIQVCWMCHFKYHEVRYLGDDCNENEAEFIRAFF